MPVVLVEFLLILRTLPSLVVAVLLHAAITRYVLANTGERGQTLL
jgi:hypothetical protein